MSPWRVVFTKQAQKDARKLQSAGLRPKAERLLEILREDPALQTVVDVQGKYGELIKKLNMPTSYVILDRVVWGVSALLSRLEATNNWRGILSEYRKGAPPVTELGRVEAEWRSASPARR